MDGSKGNFIGPITSDSPYKDENGTIVDNDQKQKELYSWLIESLTSEEQWILDLCCGTGKLISNVDMIL